MQEILQIKDLKTLLLNKCDIEPDLLKDIKKLDKLETLELKEYKELSKDDIIIYIKRQNWG